MMKTIRGTAVSILAAAALLLSGGSAFADDGGDEAFYKECTSANFAAAGPHGAVAGSFQHCIVASASSS